jgi:hypothetical protein
MESSLGLLNPALNASLYLAEQLKVGVNLHRADDQESQHETGQSLEIAAALSRTVNLELNEALAKINETFASVAEWRRKLESRSRPWALSSISMFASEFPSSMSH